MISKVVKNIKHNNYLNVFFVVNPLTLIITKLIIDEFQLDKKNTLIISFRNTDVSILDYNSFTVKHFKNDGIRRKIFFQNPLGKRILEQINTKFILYASWAFREVNFLLKSSYCVGHIYIEEGQGSYKNHKLFNYHKLSIASKIKFHLKNRVNNDEGPNYSFRDDNLGFIGLHPKSFPNIKSSRKHFLKNIHILKEVYSPKIIGHKNIALSCAERRLKNNNWRGMIDKMIECLPEGGLIKLHPSFYVSDEKIEKIKKYLTLKTDERIQICENNVILEIEMLYEKKNILGPQTSLSFYADFFGSNFKSINLP